MPWRALTVQIEAGAAEALSEALLEAGAQSVSIDAPDAPRATLCALLEIERDPLELLRAAAQAAGVAPPEFATSELEDDDWVRRSQAQFAPIEVGERLWIGPSWREPASGRVAVRLDPGLAFGTGSHPSTRLVLDFLEEQIRGGERVLDYGCGSGILALAAAKLGAARVAAVDLDPQAVETALANASQNGIELYAGLPESLPESLPEALYDVVVSNILAQPLIVLAPLFAARTARGGRIALAGILEREAEEVAAAYAPWFDARAEQAREGWSLVTGERR